MNKIVKVVSTDSTVRIVLKDGVELHISSNKGSFNFHFSFVKVPLKWGYDSHRTAAESSNTFNCYYEPYHEEE